MSRGRRELFEGVKKGHAEGSVHGFCGWDAPLCARDGVPMLSEVTERRPKPPHAIHQYASSPPSIVSGIHSLRLSVL